MPVVKALVEFVVVVTVTILADRSLSTRAAVGVLCVGLLVMGGLIGGVIKPLYEQALEFVGLNKRITIVICIILGAGVGAGFGLWLTKSFRATERPTSSTGTAKTLPKPDVPGPAVQCGGPINITPPANGEGLQR